MQQGTERIYTYLSTQNCKFFCKKLPNIAGKTLHINHAAHLFTRSRSDCFSAQKAHQRRNTVDYGRSHELIRALKHSVYMAPPFWTPTSYSKSRTSQQAPLKLAPSTTEANSHPSRCAEPKVPFGRTTIYQYIFPTTPRSERFRTPSPNIT